MGVLGNQPPRDTHRVTDDCLDSFLDYCRDLSHEYHISIDSVIRAKQALELCRQNENYIQNGDYTDEHMSGFGEIFSRIASVLESDDFHLVLKKFLHG